MNFVVSNALLIAGFVFLCVGLLAWSHRRWPPEPDKLVDALNAVLPQTQCAQCGYPGCRPYAQAIATDAAPLDLCPPGGPQVQAALASLMGTEAGQPLPAPQAALAVIDETTCIGCALCLPACPVDAIVGAKGYLHTVLARQCTGCELCIAPCPVDCITLAPHQAALG